MLKIIEHYTQNDRSIKSYYINHDDLYNSFLWNAADNKEEEVDMDTLIEIDAIPTKHSFAAPVFFKPTLQEVYDQIPKTDKFKDAIAFTIEILSHNNYISANDKMYHVAVVRVYKLA